MRVVCYADVGDVAVDLDPLVSLGIPAIFRSLVFSSSLLATEAAPAESDASRTGKQWQVASGKWWPLNVALLRGTR